MDYHFDSQEDIKLIIMLVIKDFNIPVSNAYIVDTILSRSYADYFDIQQHLYDLTESGLVTYYTDEEVRYYSLTHKGTETLEYFSSRIPTTVREKLFSTARLKARELRNSLNITGECKKINDGEYCVSLNITESGYDVFSLSLSVGSKELAEGIAARFEKDPSGVYSKIFSALIDGDSSEDGEKN